MRQQRGYGRRATGRREERLYYARDLDSRHLYIWEGRGEERRGGETSSAICRRDSGADSYAGGFFTEQIQFLLTPVVEYNNLEMLE